MNTHLWLNLIIIISNVINITNGDVNENNKESFINPFTKLININTNNNKNNDLVEPEKILDEVVYKQMVDYKNFAAAESFNSQNVNSYGTEAGLNIIQDELLVRFEKVQDIVGEKFMNCIPGSLYYKGDCIFFSERHQKLSWLRAQNFCKKLPLNSSFLVIEDDEQMEAIQTKIIELRETEKPIDQLVFFVGFRQYQSIT
jgi:hypothetical protein